MRIAVVGAGGVGGYFGARLAQSGEEVAFIARGAQLAAIQSSGLAVYSPQGNALIRPARATNRPEEVGVVDAVILGVKTWQVGEAARQIRPLLGPATAVLPLQNGVSASDEIDECLGAGRALGGATWISVSIERPGVIRHHGIAPRIALGELSGEVTARATALARALEKTGARVELTSHIRRILWTKFVFMAAGSAVGSVARVPIGELRENPETRLLLRAAMEEVVAVGGASGIWLEADVVEQTLAFVDSLPYDGTSSMQRDVMAGRPSELEAQSGTVVRLGRALGVPTPTHRMLYALLAPQERRARGGVSANG